ncbi:Ada metal-binding domain-containing protein [Rhodobacter ferrooxidans]|uniref:Ada metal-binding domain protein n=1 Tax=Rhodobacter ferrooxidans TaxID=371731 RepID=C8S455_9RHOB|nr:Ada metal-binding domain-containing protein [Rhodobacter sp. SW2]EEW24221.1 Ada metal-binding domain protein [Rhodobacter sp. SW2]
MAARDGVSVRTTSRPVGDAEWAALLARQVLPLFYGVRSTGVLCRFGCAARAPLRRNVVVFDTVQAAAEAGFRPCKRCCP